MRLLVLLWIPIFCYCWKECIYTECKPFWNHKCAPPDNFPQYGGNTKWCTGVLWIRHECCRERKHEVEPWRHVERPKEVFLDDKKEEEME